MSFPFSADRGLVIVSAEVTGPVASAVLRLALDTGATGKVINVAPLVAAGYDPSLSLQRVQVTTGSGVEFAAKISLVKISALGQGRTDFPVLCHTLPPSAGVDGVLGLDFLRGHVLTLDFQKGEIMLA